MNETTKRVRGKGKKPKKVMYPVRLDQEQLNQLKELGGNVSNHVRQAIKEYLLKNKC